MGGGGTGCAAAWAAAKAGADVTLVERYNCLGGLSTGGLVMVVGFLGALIAGFVFGGGASFINGPITLMSVLMSVVGAVILLAVLRLVRGGFRRY